MTILEVRHTTLDHAMAAPMMAQLAEANYLTYGDVTEFRQYQAADFAAPDGALLVLLDAGRPVAGGAFRRYDRETAELKRMWTHTAHRRRGHARRVLTELETEAAARGYRRVYLTTGWLQPAAAALYRAAGYTERRLRDRAGVTKDAFETLIVPNASFGASAPSRRRPSGRWVPSPGATNTHT